MSAPTWSADGQRIYAQVSRHGGTALYAFDPTGEQAPRVVVGGRAAIGAFSLDGSQLALACLRGNMDELAQVWVYDLTPEGALKRSSDRNVRHARKRTAVGGALFDRRDLGKVEELWFKSADGTDLQGWILTPPGFDPAQKYPAILEIHGGPTAQYGYLFMHEFRVFSAQGYVVFFTNPRGSQGYGEAHCKAVFDHFGEDDYTDVMAWADHVQALPYVDETRMGVTGGSYGGFMTNWIIGHDHRFAAAVTQRSVSNWVSFYGSADMNWSFQAFLSRKPA
jgi:dipeptidyl aminopeptidase/acylaminoacyl peptidase